MTSALEKIADAAEKRGIAVTLVDEHGTKAGRDETFWERWERRWGEFPGNLEPRLFWHAGLGLVGVRVGDLPDLTPAQLDECADLFEALYGGGR